MSHRHGDHMGGMSYLLGVNPKVRIYAPKEGFGVYGSDLPCAFYRQDESLPAEQRYYDGRPPDVMRFGSAWPQASITLASYQTLFAASGERQRGMFADLQRTAASGGAYLGQWRRSMAGCC